MENEQGQEGSQRVDKDDDGQQGPSCRLVDQSHREDGVEKENTAWEKLKSRYKSRFSKEDQMDTHDVLEEEDVESEEEEESEEEDSEGESDEEKTDEEEGKEEESEEESESEEEDNEGDSDAEETDEEKEKEDDPRPSCSRRTDGQSDLAPRATVTLAGELAKIGITHREADITPPSRATLSTAFASNHQNLWYWMWISKKARCPVCNNMKEVNRKKRVRHAKKWHYDRYFVVKPVKHSYNEFLCLRFGEKKKGRRVCVICAKAESIITFIRRRLLAEHMQHVHTDEYDKICQEHQRFSIAQRRLTMSDDSKFVDEEMEEHFEGPPLSPSNQGQSSEDSSSSAPSPMQPRPSSDNGERRIVPRTAAAVIARAATVQKQPPVSKRKRSPDTSDAPRTSKIPRTDSVEGEEESEDENEEGDGEEEEKEDDEIEEEEDGEVTAEVNDTRLRFDDFIGIFFDQTVNDTLVDRYLSIISGHVEIREKTHVFSCLFFKELTIGMAPNVHNRDGDEFSSLRYENVKNNFKVISNWTTNTDLFKMDYVVVPVADDLHWYLIVLIKPWKCIVPSNEKKIDDQCARRRGFKTKEINATYAVVFDSLYDAGDQKRETCIDIIRDYLELEYLDKKGSSQDGLVFDRTRLGILRPKGLPQQSNFFDSAYFLMKYAETFLSKPPSDQLLRQGVHWTEWYSGFEITVRYMRDLVARTIEKKTEKKVWKEFKLFENRLRDGWSPARREKEAMHVARSRRYPSEERLPKGEKRVRTHSEPPSFDLPIPSHFH